MKTHIKIHGMLGVLFCIFAVAAYSAPQRIDIAPGSITSSSPFVSIDLPEGVYDVTVHLGSPDAASDTTVKAENRRLMLESVKTAKGETTARTFTVSVHTPDIPGSDKKVSLKPNEIGAANWDSKLTLEFNGPSPAVSAIEIARNETALNVFLAGDSTVTDQQNEPWASWGQMLPRFFAPGTVVANYAQSGLALGSFHRQNRLEKILNTLRPGDYVFIQFGHNDMKEKNGGAFTTYAGNLREYVDAIVAKKGKPVLISPMYRRRFDKAGKLQNTHGDYPAAVRKVAEEKNVPFIDLHTISGRLFTALGVEKSKDAFVFAPANTYPNQPNALADNSHFSNYGAYELARCIVEAIRVQLPELAVRLAPDAGRFNPEHPDDPKKIAIPSSPSAATLEKPEGS
ncbi:rhamnogalacturonan acetylesterase [Ereboglobus luteus]|nr:rhamnogalacturonan acetylesterase [Ereboglobus luteus]